MPQIGSDAGTEEETMPDETVGQQRAEDAGQPDTISSLERASGAIPGDTQEGSSPQETASYNSPRLSDAETQAQMEQLEEGLDQGSGVLAEGVHVGTPAGGTIPSRGEVATGTARDQQSD